jgi:hypothetical protein
MLRMYFCAGMLRVITTLGLGKPPSQTLMSSMQHKPGRVTCCSSKATCAKAWQVRAQSALWVTLSCKIFDTKVGAASCGELPRYHSLCQGMAGEGTVSTLLCCLAKCTSMHSNTTPPSCRGQFYKCANRCWNPS